MFQLRRNRVLVVLVLMSIFVVTTQAFSVTDQPVVIDWQYDQWGDSGLSIATDSEVYEQVTTNHVRFSFQLYNDAGGITETDIVVRVELVDYLGVRAHDADGYDDSEWLVQTDSTITSIAAGVTSSLLVFDFQDSNVDTTISTGTGGTFIIYASTGTDMDILNMVPVERTPVLSTMQTIRPTVATDLIGSWTGATITGDYAWDTDTGGTPTANTGGDIHDTISFTTFEPAATLPITRVDVNLHMQVVGFDTPINKADDLTIVIYVGVNEAVRNVIDVDMGAPTTIPFTDVQEPGDGVWTVAEIGQIEVRIIDGVQNHNQLDVFTTYDIYEVWVVVNP